MQSLAVALPYFELESDPWQIGVFAVLGAGGLFLVLLFAILRALPERVEYVAAREDDVPPEARDVVLHYEALGFERVGAPMWVKLNPVVILVGMVHRGEAMFGTVYQTTTPRLTVFDFVTMLEVEGAGLTSSAHVYAGTQPAAPGDLRQIFPGLDAPAVFERHRQGVAFLQRKGIRPWKAVTADLDLFQELLRASLARARKTFLKAPVRNTLIAVWRTVSKRVPQIGLLETQRFAQRQIQTLQDRGSAPAQQKEAERAIGGEGKLA